LKDIELLVVRCAARQHTLLGLSLPI